MGRLISWLALLAAFACTLRAEDELRKLVLIEQYLGYDIPVVHWPYFEHLVPIVVVAKWVIGVLMLLITAQMLITVASRVLARNELDWPDHFQSVSNLLAATVLLWSAWNVTGEFISIYGHLPLSVTLAVLYVAIAGLVASVLLTGAGVGDEQQA